MFSDCHIQQFKIPTAYSASGFVKLVDETAMQYEVSYESIRRWCYHFGQDYSRIIRAKQGQGDDVWYLDEVLISMVTPWIFWSKAERTKR